MTEVKRIKFITFRVTPDEYSQIERAASESDLEPNNWCRDLALSVANGGQRFTINERILHTEISQLRFLVVHGFSGIFGRNTARGINLGQAGDASCSKHEGDRYRVAVRV